jgi:hypothetical protein
MIRLAPSYKHAAEGRSVRTDMEAARTGASRAYRINMAVATAHARHAEEVD